MHLCTMAHVTLLVNKIKVMHQVKWVKPPPSTSQPNPTQAKWIAVTLVERRYHWCLMKMRCERQSLVSGVIRKLLFRLMIHPTWSPTLWLYLIPFLHSTPHRRIIWENSQLRVRVLLEGGFSASCPVNESGWFRAFITRPDDVTGN